MKPVAVIVHGGAWSIPDSAICDSCNGVKAAARAAHRILANGGSAVDAVVAAVTILEDNPAFDAGRGSVLNADGAVEMDAAVMDGRKLTAGAVACVQNIANPVQLARIVMEQTEHTLLVGQGAERLADQHGVSRLSADQFCTPAATAQLEEFGGQFSTAVRSLFKPAGMTKDELGCDTVGAVAVDCHGNTAYATSTGGISGKLAGRVGDSPIIGAGGYADDTVGAVSATGHGESISKICLSHLATVYVRQGTSVQLAAQAALDLMYRRVGGSGGLVIVNSQTGETGHHCTTRRMAWAAVSHPDMTHLHYGIEPDDDISETLD